jgi:O-antigen/teichoic acid export membrane protein
MNGVPLVVDPEAEPLGARVRRAVIWRSGSQIVAQTVQWAATFLVIRLLSPSDYGLFAMAQVVLTFLAMVNGYGLASGLVRADHVGQHQIRQMFGMLIVINGGLAVVQIAIAPIVAAYYRQPQIADILRVQALLYLATPFLALPQALLSRTLDFKNQARANICASTVSASVAAIGALAGWGVWTLVAAPIALFGVRAVIMTWSIGGPVMPSFDFRGSGALMRFGGVMAAGQFVWFLQSQADVLIAGRAFSAHDLGIYTTALFLAQIFVAKVVPPLNEVAFSAYARLQHDHAARAGAFVRSVRLVMIVALPFYLGLAATAEPLVATVLGPHWAEAAPVVRIIAWAMPCMTLLVLYTPACDAGGRPGIGVANGAIGAAILTTGFLIGVSWGPLGLAVAWAAAYPLYLIVASARALPVIGAKPMQLAQAIAPAVLAALMMALVVTLVDHALPVTTDALRLAALVATGALTYAGWLLLFARGTVREAIATVRGR